MKGESAAGKEGGAGGRGRGGNRGVGSRLLRKLWIPSALVKKAPEEAQRQSDWFALCFAPQGGVSTDR